LQVDHPDILTFIDAKLVAGALADFNLSVGITDAYMSTVEHNEFYELHHPTTGKAMERPKPYPRWLPMSTARHIS
jgi:ribonucleoside-diphosphate reductase alpha chain